MKHQLALGLDPSEERRKEAATAPAGEGSSFEEVAREWLEARILSWVAKYASRIVSRLEGVVFSAVGHLAISQITPREMLDIFRKIHTRELMSSGVGKRVSSRVDHLGPRCHDTRKKKHIY